MRDRTTLRILLLAVVGTACTVALLAHDLSEADHISNLLLAGEEGPSVDAVTADIPDADLAPERGHDGQQFYAIARAPMHLDEASEHLDRPHYRLQRPLFPVLAWALHPSGGGTGLVVALLAVGIAGVLLSGVAAGALSNALGGGTWPALLVPVLPGAFGGLRITTADTLALGLLLGALWAVETGRFRIGIAAAVAAVLAKESMALLLVAHAVTRRTRESVLATLAAVASAGTWWVALRFLVDSDVAQVKELTWPFGGMVVYVDEWLSGRNQIGAAMAIGSFLLAFVALWRRGPSHPLFGPLAAMTALASIFAASVVALDYNAIRTLGPLLVLAVLTLGTPTPDPGRDGAAEPRARRRLVGRHGPTGGVMGPSSSGRWMVQVPSGSRTGWTPCSSVRLWNPQYASEFVGVGGAAAAGRIPVVDLERLVRIDPDVHAGGAAEFVFEGALVHDDVDRRPGQLGPVCRSPVAEHAPLAGLQPGGRARARCAGGAHDRAGPVRGRVDRSVRGGLDPSMRHRSSRTCGPSAASQARSVHTSPIYAAAAPSAGSSSADPALARPGERTDHPAGSHHRCRPTRW